MGVGVRRRLTQRTATELACMRRAGAVVAQMHQAIRALARPGVTTGELDQAAREVLRSCGATSNFLGYHGYPAVICSSPNDMIVHGIPGSYRLADGDLISIDCGAIVDGWHGDAAFTAGVGSIAPEAQRLIDIAERSLAAAIGQMVTGRRLGDVSNAVQRVAESAGAGIVDGYCGHGIGRAMHEEPDVPNIGPSGRGPKLDVGVVLAIEPMLTLGIPDTRTLDDEWTVVTVDGSLAVHVEHTVAVTADGPQILTLL
jgi:methionyl aminopeptidase